MPRGIFTVAVAKVISMSMVTATATECTRRRLRLRLRQYARRQVRQWALLTTAVTMAMLTPSVTSTGVPKMMSNFAYGVTVTSMATTATEVTAIRTADGVCGGNSIK